MKPATSLILIITAISVASCSRAPADQEECREAAADRAKTELALRVLVENCVREFPASRAIAGGYQIYDAGTNRWFKVSGPKPTAADLNRIREEIKKIEMELRETRRNEEALRQAQVEADMRAAAEDANRAAADAAEAFAELLE